MRYMGDLDVPLVNAMTPYALDPAVKAQMLAQAATLPDEKAKDVQDLADATHYGKQTRMARYAIGAAVGVIATFIVLRKRR